MRTTFKPFAVLFKLATCLFALLCFPTVSSTSSPPADSTHFCVPFDYEQWRRDHPMPAAKRPANLDVGEPRTVRLIYFLPNDRQAQPDIDAQIDMLIKDVQQSFAEQMENHGFGRRTFRFETDDDGKAVVHHVKGKFNDAHYLTETFGKVWEEIVEQFDLSRNIYLVTLDVSSAAIDSEYCGQGSFSGPESGMALLPAAPNSLDRGCFNVGVAAHELGHAFGLVHDRLRNATRRPSSYHNDQMVSSFCAAEWLDAHRYFNLGQSYPEIDKKTIIQMLPPRAVPPNALRLRYEITDPDGLHQTQLAVEADFGAAVGCQGISGERVTVEFVTPEVTEPPGNIVRLRVVDVYGNFTEQGEKIDITALLSPENVSIPDANFASVVRETLGLPPGDAVTQLDMLRLANLDATGRQITDLTGLEHAVNLAGLSLGENQIHDFTSLAGLTILGSLTINNNSISDLSPLAGLTDLKFLDFGENSVSDLSPLAGLTDLTYLDFGGNSVSDLSPLAGLTYLTVLDFGENSVSDLSPLAGLTDLTYLDFGGNSVSDLSPLAGLTDLTVLSFWGNSVSDLSPLAGLTDLTYLDFGENSVSDLSPLAGLTDLTYLDSWDNSVSDLSPLAELNKLETLNLWANPLSYPSINTHIPALQSRGVTVGFHARTLERLEKISGDGQEGPAGAQLAEPFVVSVLDQNGSPFAETPVTFTVAYGGGALSAATVTTDSIGRAATTLTLGRQPGKNAVAVTVAGLDSLTFTAVGIPSSDFDGNGVVGFTDFVQFAAKFGLSDGDAGYDARFDLDGNTAIGFGDFLIFANAFGDKVSTS